MQVTYFHRKRRSANFSIESIFDDVRKRLAGEIDARVHVAPYPSNGFFRRLAIAVDARGHQGQVNHVTGDINFIAIVLDRRRTILTSHDCSFLARTKGLKRRLLKLLWVDLPVKRARFITTVSEEAKRDLLSHTRCEPNKIVVIHNAISDAFRYRPKALNSAEPRILQVGTAPNKNIARLIEALERIPCTLVIIGPLNEQLDTLLQQHHIRYENYTNVSVSEMVQQYECADLVAFASTIEGFGLPILEAQAVGRPVVTSNVSSMPEVAGDAACFVDPFDASSIRNGILRCIREPKLRSELVEKGLANVKRFHADVVARQYLALYQTIASEMDIRQRGETEPASTSRVDAAGAPARLRSRVVESLETSQRNPTSH